MRIAQLVLGACLGLGAVLCADEAPELNVVTTFPNNPFSLVQNGRSNRVVFSVTHPPKADRALVLEEITGAFLNPAKADGQKSRVMRNLKSVPVRNVNGQPLQIPYDFYSEFKPQQLDVEFRFKVLDQGNSKRYNINVYRGSVTVEEPAQSLLDPQLLSVYALLALLVGGIAYVAYTSYVAPSLRTKAPAKKRTAAPAPAPASSASDDWLPKERNLRPRKQAPKKK